MDKFAYLAMSGAKETMLAQAKVAQNLANANTTGFKADYNRQRTMPIYGEGLESRVFALTDQPGYSFQQGPVITTDNPLDVAIEGEGWFVVQGADGNESLTRNGSFNIAASGMLETATGLPVVGENGPIIFPPIESVAIGIDGTISARPLGAPENAIQVIGRLKLANPEQAELRKGTDGYFERKDGASTISDAAIKVHSGVIEGSNVNPVAELTQMIELSRRFEIQIKMLSDAAENDQALDRLLQV
jgi:flagellar basal-body rod protein FlgF